MIWLRIAKDNSAKKSTLSRYWLILHDAVRKSMLWNFFWISKEKELSY